MKRLVLLLPVVLLLVGASVPHADTIHVPGDQPTMQTGINASMDGDTVLVADGVYTGDGNRDIGFYGKAIVVKSEYGPESCIINCSGSESDPHRGFYFNWQGGNGILDGFTVTNGWTANGGAIYCYHSSLIIRNNIIINNTAERGGGIHLSWSSPLITGNLIINNTATVLARIMHKK